MGQQMNPVAGSEQLLVAGRYRVTHEIARGGMGTVYAGTDLQLQRRVAVKVLRHDFAGEPAVVERFRREARAVARLSHPNIAKILDFSEEPGTPVIVMELLEGRDLSRLLRAEGALEPVRAAAIAACICDALAEAHRADLVHRDVKPGNVFVCRDGSVKVTDFGIARAAGESRLTATGSFVGTASYISPEQASGQPASPASDIYSTGTVLYEMLTGAPPFGGATEISVAMRHVTDAVPPPSEGVAGIPQELDEIVVRATAKDPRDRFASSAAMAAALRGGPTSPATFPATAEVTAPGDVPGWTRGRPRTAVIAAATIALVLLVAAVSVLLAGRDAGLDEPANQPERAGEPVEQPATQRNDDPAGSEEAGDGYFVTNEIIGLDAGSVADVLRSNGFEVEIRDRPSRRAEGTVIDTRPRPGSRTEVQPGDVITLIVSRGRPAG